MIKNLNSIYYKIDTPSGILHIHIDYDNDNNIQEIFLRVSPIGTEISNITAMLGVFLSESIKRGLDLDKAIRHLNTSKSHKKIIMNENTTIETIEQAVAIALRDFKEKICKKKDYCQK